jgi:hypothetical protein
MPYPLQEKFDPNGPISQVPRDWFETVAKILNYLTCNNGDIVKTASPSDLDPWIIVPASNDDPAAPVIPPSTDCEGMVLTVINAAGTVAWAEATGGDGLPEVTTADAGVVPQVHPETGEWVKGWALPTAPSTGQMMYFSTDRWVTTATPATGDMLYWTGTAWAPVHKPTTPSGQQLTWATGATIPTWTTPAEVPTTGKAAYKCLTISSDGATVAWDYLRAT